MTATTTRNQSSNRILLKPVSSHATLARRALTFLRPVDGYLDKIASDDGGVCFDGDTDSRQFIPATRILVTLARQRLRRLARETSQGSARTRAKKAAEALHALWNLSDVVEAAGSMEAAYLGVQCKEALGCLEPLTGNSRGK